MPELLLLGSGDGFDDPDRLPTMLALRGSFGTVLIDCGANPAPPLEKLGVPLDTVERLIVTHSHQDHTLGFAQLVESLGRSGRHRPLPIHGPLDALDKVKSVLADAGTRDWHERFELEWHTVPLALHVLVAATPDFEILASLGVHSVPVIGLRIRALQGGGVLAYSCDGEVSVGTRALAQAADLLVHEAKGYKELHATALAGAELARHSGARRLVLVHYSNLREDLDQDYQSARAAFAGAVFLGRDLDRYEF